MDIEAAFPHHLISISQEVQEALQNKRPVVALESTIITHGMVYPQNYETAISLESIIRDKGVVPATIAILSGTFFIQGKIHIGLSQQQIEDLSQQKDVYKCSRRDLSRVIALGQFGSTTVAATMMICKMVKIPIFVTGGIGGVHRFGESTMDISADLRELGQTSVNVVCAGAKSILDIKRTLEYLETEGVPVIGIFNILGYKTMSFPAFFTPDSGFFCSGKVDNASEAAKIVNLQFQIKVQQELSINTGILFAVPIPEQNQAEGYTIQKAIDQALEESILQKIEGPQCTPFLLKRVNELTGGESSKSNIALIQNNARVGAEIALELQKLSF